MRLWTGRGASPMLLHESNAESVAWSPDGTLLASGDGRGQILPSGMSAAAAVERTLLGHDADVSSVAWSPDGTRLASAGNDQTIRLWDVAGGEEQQQLIGHDGWVNCLAWSPDGDLLASGGFDGTVRLWDAQRRCAAGIGPAIAMPSGAWPVRPTAVCWLPPAATAVSVSGVQRSGNNQGEEE